MLYIQKSFLQSVSYFMAKKDVRFYLNGIHVKTDGSRFIIEASDGYSLAFVNGFTDCDPFETIIPLDTISAIIKMKPNYMDELIGISNDKIGYSNSLLSYSGIDGKFPDIKRVWDTSAVRMADTALKINPTFYSRIGDCMKALKVSDFNSWHTRDKLYFTVGCVKGIILPLKVKDIPSIPEYEEI